jgi:hypothetical protein
MRKLRLKEQNTDLFLQLEDNGKGALLVIEEAGNIVAQFSLSLRQMGQIRDWNKGLSDEFFKRNKVTIGKHK